MWSAPHLSAATVARQPDRHPQHLLEMWAPSAGQPVAPFPVTGALPPHANGPRYPGTTPLATHAVRTGREEGHGHSGVRPQRQGTMEVPPGNVGHPTPGHHLPGAGQTPQRHAGGSRLSGQTPMLPSTGLANGPADHIPPPDSVPVPVRVRLSDTGPREEQRLCPHQPGGNRDHSPGGGRACYPETPTRRQHTVGHRGTGSTNRCLPTNDAMPHTAPRRPHHRHFRGCLQHYKPHPSSRGGGSFGVESRHDRPTAPTPPHRGYHLDGLLSRGTEDTGLVVDAVNDTHQKRRDDTHHVWVVVDAAVDFQIVRRLAREPLHKATDASLGTHALQLWTALRRLPKHVVLHLVKQESHQYSLGNGHIDLHAHNQLAEYMPETTCTHTSNTCCQSAAPGNHQPGCQTIASITTRGGHTTTHNPSAPWRTFEAVKRKTPF